VGRAGRRAEGIFGDRRSRPGDFLQELPVLLGYVTSRPQPRTAIVRPFPARVP
jgi:hypothetical protein